ncbi:hypothetical protein SDRG_02933 [Saprolegnia diclina VS20]|uniref:Uncharacterized protein n=1 Tax=Saprolegnia diclina (strain VS20) TaxID=1156394 RepID=T0S9R3_SAPDV|nr:hypothetical protein SDRG_02933 [Saprolegnia diclina VS20]EQC39492.1 hypothetical protein SDRG_02933 [Saprolegnia diclina VS20]|eukprot:XP_008606764.1 hypothetical protein SDRG_02933 [Saprolegnia diclina VS20]
MLSPHSAMTKNASCGVAAGRADDYDMSLHIASVFIILGLSALGAATPVATKHVTILRHFVTVMPFISAFGVGVVLATALVHILPPANDALNDPCLDLSFPGLANVIAVAAVLVSQWFQTELVARFNPMRVDNKACDLATIEDGVTTTASPLHQVTPFHCHEPVPKLNAEDPTSRKISVLIFELGVVIHSVIIGLNLGVASGTTFTTLLTAICFHQFFEGVAVGSSALVAFEELKTTLWTVLGFAVATPLGIVLGIGVSTTYAASSSTALWVQGCMNAVAAGILIYTGIVELLANQYTNNPTFLAQSGKTRALTYAFLGCGAAAMSTIMYWT